MYAETEKKINMLRHPNEMLFRFAVSHLIDVGVRHLTEENIESTCAEIMKEDDTNHIMTNTYKCDIVRLAGELAKLDHVELLVYLQRNLIYDVFDGVVAPLWPEKFKEYINYMEWEAESASIYRDLRAIDLSNKEIEYLGYGYCIPEDADDDD